MNATQPTARRIVTHKGIAYCVKRSVQVVPDLGSMDPLDAAMWLCRCTYKRGYSRQTNPLAGIGDALTIK